MQPIRVMLADSNPAFVKAMLEALKREDGFEIVASALNGSDALKTALSAQPDVLVTGLIMPVMDGFALIEAILKAKLDIRIIVLTELKRDCFIRQAMELGASYYMVKPADPAILASRIRDSLRVSRLGSQPSPFRDPGDAIGPMLTTFGVAPGTVGYRYLHFAIELAARMENLSGRITTELYPAVARAFHTDQRNVERAIRHAIQTACAANETSCDVKPTNGELIAKFAQQCLVMSMHR